MISIRAKIKLTDVRKTAFASGYRPLFNFLPSMKTTGQIILIDHELFYPKEEGIVLINFLNKEFLGNDFEIGKVFSFDEGTDKIIGTGVILEIMNM